MPDDEVRDAVTDLEHSILMTSGAGCGKTYQMVERYIHLLRQGAEVSRIVAVTFTEKAAQELKGRVRQRCRELADQGGAEGARWQGAARQLELAPIGTIHSFCGRLLHENAVPAGLDPQFAALDETEQSLLLRDAVRDCLLARLHAREDGAERIVAAFAFAGATAVLRELVGDRERHQHFLREPPEPAELLELWRCAAQDAGANIVDDVTSHEQWLEALEALQSVSPPDPDDKAAERRAACLDHAAQAADAALPLDQRLQALEGCMALGTRQRLGSKSNWAGAEDALAALRQALRLLADLKDEYRARLRDLLQAESSETAGLAAAICVEAAAGAEAYRGAKDRRSSLDFADLQILARDLLRDHPEVLQRCHGRYQHILIDEFQDTNALQKEILWYLAGGDVAAGQMPSAGKLFVVGDAKQSIYGFRGADVAVFNRTQEEFEQHPSCRVVRLDESRRSHPSLVAFHNSLFSHPAVMGADNPDPYEASYEPLRAHRPPLEGQPDAELLLVAAPEQADDRSAVRDLREVEADALAQRIEQIVEAGDITVCPRDEQGQRSPRPARLGDFAILFRAMTDVGLYEAALRRRGIPFYTVAGRGFYARQEIRDCLSLLRVLENAADDLSLAAVLRSPFFGISDDSLFWLRQAEDHLMQALGQAASGTHPHQAQLAPGELDKIARAWEVLSRLRSCKNQMGLSELVERLLAETGLTGTLLTQFAGRQAVANLRKLTDLARSFEGRGEFSLREFIAYLRDLVVAEHHEGLAAAHEEAGDVVQLLTVHKAKGMQWPIVVVPDLARRLRGDGPTVAASRELGPIPKVEMHDGERRFGAAGQLARHQQAAREEAEERRLLYVALTRAEDHLILSSSVQLTSKGGLSGGPWLRWIAVALDLDPQLQDGAELTDEDGSWTRVVRRPDAEPARRAARRWAARADLSLVAEALAAAPLELRGDEERLLGSVEPVSTVQSPAPRYSVTELSAYLDCPRRYELRYVRDMPEALDARGWLGRLSAGEHGTLAHQVMELVGRDGAAELENAIALAAFPRAIGMRLSETERARLADGVRWFLETPQYRDWIGRARRLRSEVPFAASLDGAIIEGKIDALAEDAQGDICLLDYKTRPGGDEVPVPQYQFQMGLYCAAVEAATGSLPQIAVLVYLDGAAFEPLDTEGAAGDSLARARQALAGIRERRFAPPERPECSACSLAYACELA